MITLTESIRCASPREELWPLIADTDVLNRLVGMAPVEPTPRDRPDAARFQMTSVIDGIRVTYLEYPFEWVRPAWFEIRRPMLSGPLAQMVAKYTLEETGAGGTEVGIHFTLKPRSSLLTWPIRLMVKRRLAAVRKVISDADAELQRSRAAAAVASKLLRGLKAPRIQRAPWTRAADALRASAGDDLLPACERLITLVETGQDAELRRLRPFVLADSWGMDRGAVLTSALHAVESGLLDMSWDLVCPSCSTGADRIAHLSDLSEAGHCDFCDIDFDLPLDRALEAVFTPSTAIRPTAGGAFCSGGPARTPHVHTQRIVGPGGVMDLDVPDTSGRLRLFIRGGIAFPVEVTPDASPAVEAPADAPPAAAPIRVAPGGAIRVTNPHQDERHLKLEGPAHADQAATAWHLMLNPAFRERFSSEVLAPGRSLQVARVSLLFSDLSGSTALYAAKGDAAAFRLVQDHFDLLYAVVAEHGGSVVKTIGDAVMAAFDTDQSLARAGIAMLRAWPDFQAIHDHAAGIGLKIGGTSGPCYVVTANGVLDYFGQTVNLAARLQGQAAAGELILLEDTVGELLQTDILEETLRSEPFPAQLRGFDHPLKAIRVTIPS